MHYHRNLPRCVRGLTGALLLLPTFACVKGEGSLGDYTESGTGTDTGADTGADSGSSGGEPTCIEDCDLEFGLGYIAGPNYALEPIFRLGDATCEGPRCPESVSPVGIDGAAIEDCLQSEGAQASPLGAEEHCRLSPTWLAIRLDLGFTTPIERSSFESVRPGLVDPTVEEPYLWHADVVELHGPGTALRGDYLAGPVGGPDRLTAVVNETCVERLEAQGIPWAPDDLDTLCRGTWNDDGVLRPLKMNPTMVLAPYAGELSTTIGESCETPDGGPDTCCSACDRALGPDVARYGVDAGGARRSPNDGTAIACDPDGDALVQCRDLVLDVERDPGAAYTYAWNGAVQAWPLPRYDKLRETHPDDRPAGLEAGVACGTRSDCESGQACIGTNAAGDACRQGADCLERTCRAEWFGGCHATEGGSGFCVDHRFSSRGAGACLSATNDFAHGVAGDRLSQCDVNGDGHLTAGECCDAALGAGAGCDPFYQPNLVDVPRYDRNPALAPEGACVCEEGQPAACGDTVEAWCEAPLGVASDPASPAGDYAVPVVIRAGGVRWDEDSMQLGVRLATIGNLPRANTESCAEARGLIGLRTVADGWLANAAFAAELLEDHDLALCSGSTYRLVLAESGADHFIRSAGNGNLDGRSEHVIETPQLRIVPNSLFPSDAVEIQSCSTFEVALSNLYDPSEVNLRKLELREGAADGPRVAGGDDCDPLATAPEIAAGAIPCLDFDAGDRVIGKLKFYVDEAIHGQVLQPGTTYSIVLPGLAEIDQMADAEAYAAAFHDACGMPLIVGSTAEELALTELGFTVDAPCG